jgi:hypothetical protein
MLHKSVFRGKGHGVHRAGLSAADVALRPVRLGSAPSMTRRGCGKSPRESRWCAPAGEVGAKGDVGSQ